MQKQVFLYGFLMAICILLLKYFEYSYFIKSFSQEVYIGIIAISFTALGIWLSFQLIKRKQAQEKLIQVDQNLKVELNLSSREAEVLEGIAEGLSNKEIGEKLFLSESTIKSHSANLFAKLNVNRRTQAVQKAREMGLLA